jgi:tRNA-specific 2-thiouridylase
MTVAELKAASGMTIKDVSVPLLDVAPGARIVVAMSGGVDSSVTAAICQAQGYETVGITLQLYDHGAAANRKGACCAGQDIHDARRVADALNIPHYVLDYESRFRESVIDDFADSYLSGETPIPCVRCNQTVKFRDLLGVAQDLGAAALATGHYVRRANGPDGAEMRRPADLSRDQSYFLFATTHEQLDFLRFPLGDLDKIQTRALAVGFDLPIATKPDSQDICFVPQGSYAAVISKLRPGAIEPGEIVHLDGQVLGQHNGVINFTVGQRRGLGLGGESEPLYVIRLEPEIRQVVVGPRSALLGLDFDIREVNWLSVLPRSGEAVRAHVKVRSTHTPAAATIIPDADGGAKVRLDEPEAGIAPGQACVFYDGNRVIGGGWIIRSAGT